MLGSLLRRGVAALVVCGVLLLVVLGGCGRDAGRPVPPAVEEALFGDAEVDAAVLALPGASVELVGRELDALTGLVEVDGVTLEAEVGDGVGASATLPGAVGLVAFVRHAPQLSANPWRVGVIDQATDTTTWVYGGRREIQSVAVTADGNVLLLAMRRTIDSTGDFEVYRVTLEPSQVERLTNTPYDESSVSISADGGVLAWEGENGGGQRAVFIREGVTESLLTLALEQREPALSGNGRYLAMIRVLLSDNHRVVRYDRSENAYQVVAGRELPVTLSDPSVSDDGTRFAYLLYRPPTSSITERQLVRYVDTVAGTQSNAFGAQFDAGGARIAQPFLARDGDHLAYAFRQGERWNVFTRRVSTGELQRVAASPAPTRNFAPHWMMPAQPDPALVGLTVDVEGVGSGGVSSHPVGIDCGSACEAGFEQGSVVTLVAAPDQGSMLTGWRGCDVSLEVHECTVLLVTEPRAITATFETEAPEPQALELNAEPREGEIGLAGGGNWYEFDITVRTTYTIETWLGTLTDSRLELYGPDSDSELLASNDDKSATDRGSRIQRVLDPGSYLVRVSEIAPYFHHLGSYSIALSHDTGVSSPQPNPLRVSGTPGEDTLAQLTFDNLDVIAHEYTLTTSEPWVAFPAGNSGSIQPGAVATIDLALTCSTTEETRAATITITPQTPNTTARTTEVRLTCETPPGTLLWSLAGSRAHFATPALASDGSLYAILQLGGVKHLVRVDAATGLHLVPPVQLGGQAVTSVIVSGDEQHIFAFVYPQGSGNDGLYRYNADLTGRTLLHNYFATDRTAPVLDESRGRIYAPDEDGQLLAISTSGGLVWATQIRAGGGAFTIPAALSNGNLVAYGRRADGERVIVGLSPNGTQHAEREMAGSYEGGFAIAGDGTVFMQGGAYQDNKRVSGMFAFNPDLTLKWLTERSGAAITSAAPVINAGGTRVYAIYATTGNELGLHAHDVTTGERLWTYALAAHTDATPLVGSDGTIYVSAGGFVDAIRDEGTTASQVWRTNVGGGTSEPGSPTITTQGILIVPTSTGLHAIATDSQGLADSPWPKLQRDPRNTGRATEYTPPTTGSLYVNVTGLRENNLCAHDANITVSGPDGYNATVTNQLGQVLPNLQPGSYRVDAYTSICQGATRTWRYDPSPTSQTVSVQAGSSATASVHYTEYEGPRGTVQVYITGLPTGAYADVRAVSSNYMGFFHQTGSYSVPPAIYHVTAYDVVVNDVTFVPVPRETYVSVNENQTSTLSIDYGGGGPPPPQPPAPPTGLSVSVVSETELLISWNAVSGATSYDLQVSTEGSQSGFGDLATVLDGATTFNHLSLVPGSTYCYRVRSVGDGGASAWTSGACAQTTAELDLWVGGLQIGQTTMSRQVPLLARKPTLARAFVVANMPAEVATIARLHAVDLTSGTVELGSIDLYAGNQAFGFPAGGGDPPPASRPVPTENRVNSLVPRMDDSFNRLLPDEWLSDGIEQIGFYVVVDPDGVVPEVSESNNRYPATGYKSFTIEEAPPLTIVFVPVTDSSEGVWQLSYDEALAFLDHMSRAAPVPRLDEIGSRVETVAQVVRPAPDLLWWPAAWARVALLRAFDPDSSRYYYGVVDFHSGPPTGLSTVGIAMGQQTALGVRTMTNYEHVWNTMVHEFGHLWGRKHVDVDTSTLSYLAERCGSPWGVDRYYPEPSWSLGAIGVSIPQAPSWDTPRLLGDTDPVADPSGLLQVTDVMSYCPNQWTSWYTYKHMYEYRVAEYASDAGGASATGASAHSSRSLAVAATGTFDVASESWSVQHLMVVDGVSTAEGAGQYLFEVIDAAGAVLGSTRFDAHEYHHGDATVGVFAVAVQVDEAYRGESFTARIVDLGQQGVEVWRSTPVVSSASLRERESGLEVAMLEVSEVALDGGRVAVRWPAHAFDVAYAVDDVTGRVLGIDFEGKLIVPDAAGVTVRLGATGSLDSYRYELRSR